MMFVTRMVEEDVRQKIDVDFIKKELSSNIAGEVALVFVCVNDDWRKNGTWKKKGIKYYRIVLAYEQVQSLPAQQVRALMLKTAKERLGLVVSRKNVPVPQS